MRQILTAILFLSGALSVQAASEDVLVTFDNYVADEDFLLTQAAGFYFSATAIATDAVASVPIVKPGPLYGIAGCLLRFVGGRARRRAFN